MSFFETKVSVFWSCLLSDCATKSYIHLQEQNLIKTRLLVLGSYFPTSPSFLSFWFMIRESKRRLICFDKKRGFQLEQLWIWTDWSAGGSGGGTKDLKRALMQSDKMLPISRHSFISNTQSDRKFWSIRFLSEEFHFSPKLRKPPAYFNKQMKGWK